MVRKNVETGKNGWIAKKGERVLFSFVQGFTNTSKQPEGEVKMSEEILILFGILVVVVLSGLAGLAILWANQPPRRKRYIANQAPMMVPESANSLPTVLPVAVPSPKDAPADVTGTSVRQSPVAPKQTGEVRRLRMHSASDSQGGAVVSAPSKGADELLELLPAGEPTMPVVSGGATDEATLPVAQEARAESAQPAEESVDFDQLKKKATELFTAINDAEDPDSMVSELSDLHDVLEELANWSTLESDKVWLNRVICSVEKIISDADVSFRESFEPSDFLTSLEQIVARIRAVSKLRTANFFGSLVDRLADETDAEPAVDLTDLDQPVS